MAASAIVDMMKVIQMLDMNEVMERVPKECPFCRLINDTKWTEFKVVAAESVYIDGEKRETHNCNDAMYIQVVCTQCEEEIREEDI